MAASATATTGPRPTHEVWGTHWRGEQVTRRAVEKMVNREQRTRRWLATRKALADKFGSLRGLRTIEMGSGKGDVSLLLALAGADATLLDYEADALVRGREQFACYGLAPETVVGDLFDVAPELLGRFDVAISWGVVEHFRRPEAVEACRAHLRAVHDQGMVIISVPNAWSLPYRLNKWYRELRGTWTWGLELPFSPVELREIGRRLGLRNVRVHGSPVVRDFDQFLLHPVMGRLERYFGLRTEVPSPIDRLLGHALTLFGQA